MKAIETNALVKDKNKLILDDFIDLPDNKKVKLIVLIPDEDEISEIQWLNAASGSNSLDFLKEPEEDIYTNKDGKPFESKR